MRIADVIFAPGQGAFYNDDQAAVKGGAARDGFLYLGEPVTAGFSKIRLPAAALGIGLILSDGSVHWGDMMTVQYAAAGGREAPLDAGALQDFLARKIVPSLIGLELGCFGTAVRTLTAEADQTDALPNSAKYGLSQALLAATAAARRSSMAEVISAEYGFLLVPRPVPILCQSGEDRQLGVDKMILRRADALPHGLINSPDLIGPEGTRLGDYVVWVRDRVVRQAPSGYRPRLHFDVYGGIGQAFDLDIERIVSFLCRLEALAKPFALCIESPADFGGRQAQIHGLGEIRHGLRGRGSTVRIVADEWCNTLADVECFVAGGAADLIQLKMPDMGSLHDIVRGIQVCQAGGMGVYLGGSCTETDVSARISVHVAVATQVDMMLAKPGMGVDEGYTIVANEQARLLATLEARGAAGRASQGALPISARERA